MKRIILVLFLIYQKFISPLKPPSCRFYPTCSHYAALAVQEHGAGRGLWLTAKRLIKCGPWHPGGYDPVPKRLLHNEDHQLIQFKEGTRSCCDE
jgi:uncharacterized protein